MISDTPMVELTIDGRQVRVASGTSIWEAARQAGISIPALCHDPGLEPVGVCRLCVVDVGERVLAASCVRGCSEGMTVTTQSDSIDLHRRQLTRLLLRVNIPRPARNNSKPAIARWKNWEVSSG